MSQRAGVVALLLVVVASTGASADVPSVMTVGGSLRQGDTFVDGTATFRLTVYDSPSAGGAAHTVWSEEQDAVGVDGGRFSVLLGAAPENPLPEDLGDYAELWLGVAVDGEAEMTPRARLTSVPWALRATDAASLGGLSAEQYALAAHDHDDQYVNEGQAGSVGSAMIQPQAVQFGHLEVPSGCGVGTVLRVEDGGAWACETLPAGIVSTEYTAGSGLVLSSTTFSLDPAAVQGLCYDNVQELAAALAGYYLPAGTTFSFAELTPPAVCSVGQLLARTADGWECANDAVGPDPIAYGAGLGLELKSNTFSLDVDAVASLAREAAFDTADEIYAVTDPRYVQVDAAGAVTSSMIRDGAVGLTDLGGGCGANEVLKQNADGSAWTCAPDAIGSAGSGIVLSGDAFSLLPCAAGQVLKRNGSLWECADDVTLTQADVQSWCVDPADVGVITNEMIADGQVALTKLSGTGCAADRVPVRSGAGWVCGQANGNSVKTGSLTKAHLGADDSCSDGWVLKYVASSKTWVCAPDNGGSSGAVYGGVAPIVVGTSSVSLAGCAATGDVLTWNATTSVWECATAAGNTYTAGTGITIAANVVSVSSITTNEIAADTITAADIAPNAVTSSELASGSVIGAKIAADAVTSDKIKNGTIARADLAQDACADGQVLKWSDSASSWICASDVAGSAGTTYAAASPIVLNGTTLELMSCAGNQVLKRNTTLNAWTCQADLNTTYTAGAGLALTGTQFALGAVTGANITDGSLELADLPACATGQIIKRTAAGTWACAADDAGGGATTYSAGDGLKVSGNSFSIQPCGVDQVLKYVDSTVGWECRDDANLSQATVLGWCIDPSDVGQITGGMIADKTIAPSKLGGTCSAGQTLEWDATTGWKCATDDVGPTYTATANQGLTITGGTQLGLAPCAANQVHKYDGSKWVCTQVDNTMVASGSLSLDKLAAPSPCAVGQAIKRTATGWACQDDISGGTSGGTYTSGTGIIVGSTSIALDKTYTDSLYVAKPAGCTSGQVVAWNGTTWTCVAASTGYTGANGVVLTGTVFSLDKAVVEGYAKGVAVDEGQVNSITSAMIVAGAVTSTQLGANAVVDGKVQANAIGQAQLKDAAVGAAELADNAVDAASIQAGVVSMDKLANPGASCAVGSVMEWSATGWKCGTDDVGTYTANNGVVLTGTTLSLDKTTVETYAKAVCVDEGQVNGVTAPMLAAGVVSFDKLANPGATCLTGSVMEWSGTAWKCGTDDVGAYSAGTGLTLTGGTFALNKTTVEGYAKGVAVDEGQPNSITSGMITDGAVTSADIADGTIAAADIADNAVGLSKLNVTGCEPGQVLTNTGTAFGCTTPESSLIRTSPLNAGSHGVVATTTIGVTTSVQPELVDGVTSSYTVLVTSLFKPTVDYQVPVTLSSATLYLKANGTITDSVGLSYSLDGINFVAFGSPKAISLASNATTVVTITPTTPVVLRYLRMTSTASYYASEITGQLAAPSVVTAVVSGPLYEAAADGVPRLWGQGRPGTLRYGTSTTTMCSNGSIKFGLSEAMTTWEGAQAACPYGSWVCTRADRGTASCDTILPRGVKTAGSPATYRCDAVSLDVPPRPGPEFPPSALPYCETFPNNGQIGWVSDRFTSAAPAAEQDIDYLRRASGLWINEGGGIPSYSDITVVQTAHTWCCSY